MAGWATPRPATPAQDRKGETRELLAALTLGVTIGAIYILKHPQYRTEADFTAYVLTLAVLLTVDVSHRL